VDETDEAGDAYGGKRNAWRVLVKKPEGKSHLHDLGIDGRIILKRGALCM
jgi:hypothetical protein